MTHAMDTDHVDHSINVTGEYEKTWARYEELGFTLSPESRHAVTVEAGGPMVPSCTANRCAYFGESFIELIGIVDAAAPDPWHVLPLVDRYQGLHGASFGFGDSEHALVRLRSVDLASSGVLSLQRPVDTPDGPATVRARSVHIDRAKTPEGILHTAEHLTPQFVHQPRFLEHANGARYLDSVLLVVADDELPAYRDRYTAMLGRPATTDGPRQVFQLRVGRVEIIPASALPEVLPGETAPVLPFWAAQGVVVEDLTMARTLIEANGITTHPVPDGFFVSAADAYGTAVVFR
ncbi:VOC family protein [Umezawaea sp. NPDC059074]|uniref:VOC family protein n=1 Tax=Umezawaea sp. NPDC059074 TaxID=3346716 RepID=UPI0036C1C301